MHAPDGGKIGVGLDAFDLDVIALLQEDGRRSNTDIARHLRVNEATVRKRIDRLLADKTIRISAWADPLRLGYKNYANIEIRVHPPHLEEAAARIARFPEIFFLGICTGNFDILAVGLFHSDEHMYEFLSNRLGKVKGIDRASTSHIIRTIKRDFPRVDTVGRIKTAKATQAAAPSIAQFATPKRPGHSPTCKKNRG